jgi:hypothetical protein
MLLYYLIFTIALFFILLFLSKKGYLYVMAFVLIYFSFVRFLFFKFMPSIAFASGSFLNFAIVLLFIFSVIKKPTLIKSKHLLFIILSIGAFFIYLYLLAYYRGHNPIEYILFFRNYYFMFLLFVLFMKDINKKNIDITIHFKILLTILIFQSVISIAQYVDKGIADYFVIMEYERLGEIQDRISRSFEGKKLITGTLMSMHNVSVFIYCNIIFLYLVYLKKIFPLEKYRFKILIFIGLIVMVLTGIRAPIMGLFVTITLWYWYSNKIKFSIAFVLILLVGPLIFEVVYPYMEYALTHEGSTNIESPLERIAGVLAIFDSNKIQDSTVSRTIFLSSMFIMNPIFGTGPQILFSDYSISDAHLILQFVEFGMIGVLLLILPYIYLLYLVNKNCNKKSYVIMIIIFLSYLAQSVVNEGLWTPFGNAQFFYMLMVIMSINYYNIKYNLNND